MKNCDRYGVCCHRMTIVCIMVTALLSTRLGVSQDALRLLSPRLQSLHKQISTGEPDAIRDFWAELKGKSPLVEAMEGDDRHLLVTFVWRGDQKTKRVLLTGGPPAPQMQKPLKRLADTNIWFRSEQIHKASRLTYGFRVNAPVQRYRSMEESLPAMLRFPPQHDPENPNRSFMFSVIELPLAPSQRWIRVKTNVEKGKLTNHEMTSQVLKEDRQFIVYTPAGFKPKNAPTRLLIFFDAEIYTNKAFIPAPVILDNLIGSKRIPPTVAVFIKDAAQPNARARDLACSVDFAKFVATEVVPWVKEQYRVSAGPANVVVVGVSLGGLCAAFCGLQHPHVFGNVLSQSASLSYWPGYTTKFPDYDTPTGWLTQKFADIDRLPLRFYLEVGLFERQPAINVDPVLEHRRFRDVLKAKGYPIVYSEFYGGHDYVCWRGSLAHGLTAMLGDDGVTQIERKQDKSRKRDGPKS